MQGIYEVFSGSTVDAGFVKKHLEANGIKCTAINKQDESITTHWTQNNPVVIGTKILVSSEDFVKASSILKTYFDSREKQTND